MAAARTHVLVREYIEKMSGEILDPRYRKQLADLIQGHAGVYALYLDDELYYIGLASDLMRRVDRHQKDRHKGKWDRFSVYLTSIEEHIKPLESLLLRVFMPEGNRVGGKLPGARDGKRALADAMRRHDAAKRDAALHGTSSLSKAPARRSTRGRAVPGKGGETLAGLLPSAIALRADHKGTRYTARARKNGQIVFGGQVFSSPSAAAIAITGHPTNGWRSWHCRTTDGEWLPIDALR